MPTDPRALELDALGQVVSAMMPDVIDDLTALVGMPSVAFPSFPPEPVMQAAHAVVDLLQRYGVGSARLQEIPDGYPSVVAEIPGPDGAPVVLLYGHYDVQPAPMEQGWGSDPFAPEIRDGRLYGRGAADDKSGILMHAASLRALLPDIPVTVRILIEGEEETTSHLGAWVTANPDAVQADVFVIADLGNTTVGEPQVTISERGDVACIVEVKTLSAPVHSGKFGGAAPDALMTLIRMLAAVVDENGDVAVPGVSRFAWHGADFPEDLYRASSNLLPGVDLIGTGTLSERLWAHPSISVIGLDATPVDSASNVLYASARAKLSMRIVPGSDADTELDTLMRFLEAQAPWGAQVSVAKVKAGAPFLVDADAPALRTALDAMTDAYGVVATQVGSGASIPLLATLEAASPGATFVLWGAQDVQQARIHGANESVDLDELERAILAQALFLRRLGEPAAPKED